MDNIDRYGLAAQFSFEVQGSSFASMKTVRDEMNGITQAVRQVSDAAKSSGLSQAFRSMGAGARTGSRQVASQFQNVQTAAKGVSNQLQPLKAEFRALRAESRNIDFGDLHDDRQFKAATQQVHQYVNALQALENQIKGDTAAERELKAQLKSQQQIAENRVSTASAQRQATLASERQGKATAIAAGATAVALPLIGIGKESIKVLTGFDDQMSQVKAVSGATNQELAQIRQKAKDLGATTRFSASDAAAGFVLLGQAGYKTNQQLSAIDGTLNLAAAGSLELARATDITVSVLGGFQLGADQATHAADVLALTANQANLDVGDLGESLKLAGPPAKAFGATLEQTSALLGVLSNAGIRGSEAGTALRAMFLRLAAPTGMAKTAMRDLGISIADASGNIKPIDQILTDLQGSLSQLSAAEQLKAIKTIFGTEATPAIQTLLSNIKGIQDLTAANLTAAGAAQKAAKIMENNIGGSFRNFQSAAEGVLIEIGEVLAPVVIKVTNAISELMTKFIQLPQPVKTVIVVTGALAAGLATLTAIVATAAAAFFGLQSAIATSKIAEVAMTRGLIPLTGFFQTAVSAFTGSGILASIQTLATAVTTFATGPVGLAIAGFTALFALAQILAPQFNVLGGVLSALAAPIGFVFGLIKGIAEGILAALKPLMTELAPVGKALLPIGQIVGYVGDAVTQATKTFMQFAGTGETVGKVIGQVIGTLIVYPLRLVVWAVQLGINAFTQFLPTVQAVGQGIFNTIRNFVLAPLSVVGTVADAIARRMVTLFAGAAQLIQAAWQGFVNWFANLPLVGMALNIAQGLINALNHRPTEVIPLAWQGAVANIQQMLGGLQTFGESVGNFLGAVLDPGKLFGSLIDGLVAKIQGLVEAIQNSGLGKFFGNATEGLDGFIGKLQQVQAPQLAIAAVSPAVVPPVIAPVQAAPADKKRNETAIAPLPIPPNPPTGGAGGAAIQPLVIPVLPKLELPDINALLAPILQQTATEVATIAPIAIPVVPTPPTVEAIAPVMQQQNQQIQQQMQLTFGVVAKEAQTGLANSFNVVAGEWGDRWSLLERSGNTNLAMLFEPGLKQLRSSLSTLHTEFLAFAGESAQAIATLDFDKAKAAAANFGGDLLGIVQQAAKSFGSLGLSAVAFGVVSLASLSPVVLVLGGIVLGAIALATNFLGLRTILTGIFKIVQGIFQVIDGVVRAVSAIAKTIYEIGRGLGQIFSGILPALTGDFSKIGQGFNTIFTAAQTGAFELQGAFNRVFGGMARIVEGAGQTIHGVLQGISQLAQGIGTAFQLGFKGAQLAIQGMVAGADLARQAIAHLITLPDKIAAQWQNLQAKIQALPLGASFDRFKNLPAEIAAIAEQGWQRWHTFVQQLANLPLFAPLGNLKNLPALATGIGAQIQERWQSLVQFLDGLPLVGDVSQLLNLPERVQAIAGAVRERWQSLSHFLSGLPLIGDIARLINLPERVQAVAGGVAQAWRSLVSLLGSLPLLGNLTQLQNLPQEVAAISERVQAYWHGLQSFLSALPIVGDIGQLLNLPERVQAIADGVMQRWRSLTQLVSSLPLSLDLGNLTNLPERIGGIVQQATQFVQGGVEQITQLWRSLGQTLDAVPILQEFVAFARELPQLFGAVVEKIQGLWTGLGDRVSGVFNRLTGRAKQTGQEMISNLAENSPGPTFMIRQKWAFTTEQIESWMTGLTGKAQAVGQRIGDQVTGAAQKFGEGAHKGLNAVGNSFSSLGIVLSNFSPQLAGPLFLFSDLVDSSSMLAESLPEAKKFFAGLLPSLTTLGATATTVFGSMGTVAATAWAAITGPLLPFIAIAGLVVVAVTGLYLAFKTNFLGIRSLVQGVGAAIGGLSQAALGLVRGFVALIGTALKIAIAFSPIGIAIFVVIQAFKLLGRLAQATLRTLQAGLNNLVQSAQQVGAALMAPFQPLLQGLRAMVGGVGRFFRTLNQIADLLLGVGSNTEDADATLRSLVNTLLSLGGGVVAGLLAPFKLVSAAVQGIIGLFQQGMGLIGSLISPIVGVIGKLQGAWQGFQGWFGGLMNLLPEFATQAGEGIIGALNHRPTIVIPNSWEEASAKVQAQITGMVGSAQVAGGAIANNLSVGPSVNQVTDSVTDLASALKTVPKVVPAPTVAPVKAAEPQKFSFGAVLDQVRSQAANVTAQLGQAVQFVMQKFNGAAISATLFGAASMISLTPVLLVLGGVGLAVLAIASNFLGLRTVATGVTQVIKGLFEILAQTAEGAAQIIRGVAKILTGVLAALHGDFSQIQAGMAQAFEGMRTIAAGVAQGFGTSFQGILQIAQGVGEGIGQAWRTLSQVLDNVPILREFVTFVDSLPRSFAGMVEQLQSLWAGIGDRLAHPIEGLRAIAAGVAQAVETSFKGILQVAQAIGDGISQSWHSLSQVLDTVPILQSFVSFMKGLPQLIGGIVERIQAIWVGLGDAIAQPLEGVRAVVSGVVQGIETQFKGILQTVQGVGEGIGQAWRTLSQVLDTVPILREFVAFAEGLPQIFGAVVERIQGLWSGLGDRVSGVFGRLTGRAKQTGQEMVSSLAENSPGPTFQIRQKWLFTTEQLEAWMTQMVGKAQTVGQQIGDQVTGAAHKFGEGAHKGISAVGNSFSSLGIVLSNFSPQLAGPLFLFSDLVDSSSMLAESLPEAKKFFTGLIPALATLGTTATTVFGSMGTAAVGAWAAITGPLLPFIAIAAGVVVALGGLYLAFQHNFLGVRDLVQSVGSLIRGLIGLIGTALKIAIAFSPIGIAIFVVTRSFKLLTAMIRQVFQGAQALVSGLTQLLVAPFLPLIQAIRTGFRAIARFFQGLNQIANLLLGVGNGGQAATEMLQGLTQGLMAVGRGAITGLLIPFRIIGGVVQGVLALVQGGIALIGGVIAPVTTAIAQVQSAWQGFQTWFGGVMGFLPGLAEQAGQGLINALNHRPTVVIPIAWEGASARIQDELAGMVGSAEVAGGAMSQGLISDAIQNLPRTIQAIAQQFGGAAIQSALFGVAALTSLSPVILVLGGIALAALAIATNFLGIRTILGGAIKVISGLFQALKATVQGLVQIFQGIGNIIKGIFGALQGDFSLLQSGISQVFGGIRTIISGVAEGFMTSLGGALQIVKGLAEGVEQSFTWLGSVVKGIGGALTQAIEHPEQLWQDFLGLLDRIGSKVKGVMSAIASPGKLVEAVKLRVQGKAPTMAEAQQMADFDQRLAKTPDPVRQAQQAKKPTKKEEHPKILTKTEALQDTTNAVSSLGVALSAIAPQAAAPLFAISSLVDGALGLKDTIPALKAGLIALFPAFAGLGSAGLTFGGIMTAVGTTISTAFGAIAGAAGTAWAAISGPLLPFIAAAAGVVVAVGALYFAFKSNFLGIGDLIRGVVASFQAIGQVVGSLVGTLATFVGQALKISFVLSPIGLLIKGIQFLYGVVREFIGVLFSGAFEAIASVFTTLQTELGTIGSSFVALGEWIVAPFRAAFSVLAQLSGKFNRVGGQTNLISAAIRNTVTSILFPLRLIVGTLNLVIRAVSWLIQNAVNAFKFTGLGLAIRLLQTITSVITEFIATLAGGAFEVIGSFFSTIGSNFAEIGNSLRELAAVLSAPFKPLLDLFGRLTQKTDQVGNQTNLISIGIRNMVNTLLLPFRLLIGAIDFVLKGINLLIQGLTQFVNGVAAVGQAIANFLLAPFRLLNNLIQGAVGLIGQVVGALASPFQMIANLFSTLQQGMSQIPILGPLLSRFFGGGQPTTEVQRFASGGLVQGPGTSTGDRVPAMLSPNEYVVNAQATRQNYGFLDAINSGLDVESALQLMPIAPPPLIAPPAAAPAQAEPKTIEVKVELNFAPGSIVIQGGGAEAAQGFVQEVTPELQRAIRDALRDMVEFSK